LMVFDESRFFRIKFSSILYKDILPYIEYIWLIIDSFVCKETHPF
jgi:hypothetical protein